MIRAELRAALRRWREVLLAGGIVTLGVWVFCWGGLLFQALGILTTALGGALALNAWRHLRFHRDGDAPGVVEVTEGQIAYLSPSGGGFAARSEITEIALGFDAAGRPQWRIAQIGTPALLIPVAAEGADALFDAFVALPGVTPARVLGALDRRPAEGPVTVWRRHGRAALT